MQTPSVGDNGRDAESPVAFVPRHLDALLLLMLLLACTRSPRRDDATSGEQAGKGTEAPKGDSPIKKSSRLFRNPCRLEDGREGGEDASSGLNQQKVTGSR